MNLKEYKDWLKKNANKEEQEAEKVIDVILKHHESSRVSDYKIKVFPRTKFKGFEFDLLIYIYTKEENPEKKSNLFDTLIGVEFKETDIRKVITQAILRREFVDYMYIATRDVSMDYQDLFLLALFGIGWVIWEKNFAKIIVPARTYFNVYAHKVDELIDYLINRKLNRIVEDLTEIKLNKKVEELKLTKWLRNEQSTD